MTNSQRRFIAENNLRSKGTDMIYAFLDPRRIMKNLRSASMALAFAVLAASGPAFPRPQDPPIPKRSYITAHVNPHVPSIDGRIDDPVWEKVEWQGDFIQREPYEREKPTEKTAFKILFDDKALFVAIRAFDSDPARIERRVSRRDSVGGDRVDITLTAISTVLPASRFGVNAAGVKVDMLYTNGGLEDSDQDMSWDPIWDVETSVDAEGWAAEMRIPFSQLRFGNKDEQVWGLQGHPRPFPEGRDLQLAVHPPQLTGLGSHVRRTARHQRDSAAAPGRNRSLYGRKAPGLPPRPRQSVRHGPGLKLCPAGSTERSA